MRLLGVATWPFAGLDPHAYDLIFADPPWLYTLFSEKGENKSAQRHYRCLSLDDIKAFPVQDLAAEDCMLCMYATNPMLPQAFDVTRAWGFTYKTMGTWRKVTKNGKVAFGTGYILRSAHEPIIIATRGKPKTARNVRSIFDGVVREHSRKPEEGYRWAEAMMPGARRRLELFSRTNRPGWEAWGDEAGKFNPVMELQS